MGYLNLFIFWGRLCCIQIPSIRKLLAPPCGSFSRVGSYAGLGFQNYTNPHSPLVFAPFLFSLLTVCFGRACEHSCIFHRGVIVFSVNTQTNLYRSILLAITGQVQATVVLVRV